MKTEDLIATLSLNPRRQGLPPSMSIVLLAALLATVIVLSMSLLWLKPRHDLEMMWTSGHGIFLLKIAFTVAVAAAALPVVHSLSMPGRRVRWAALIVAAPFLIMLLLAGYHLAALPFSEWRSQITQASWIACLLEIPVLAIPPFAIMALLVRRHAPTNLARTGAYIGLAAGGLGGVGYALHCHDDKIVFVAIAYTAAILQTATLGAMIGPHILRWK